MAKDKKSKAVTAENAIPAAQPETEQASTEKAPPKSESLRAAAKEAAAKKRDEQNSRLMYPTSKTAREDTVFRWLQDTVIDAGGSMSWGALRAKMLAEYTPKTSKSFDESYCQAYVRGGVQEGYLTLDEKMGVKELTVLEKKADKPKEPTAAGTIVLNKMKTLTPSDAQARGEATLSVSDLTDALKDTTVKSAKAIVKTLEGLISCSLVFKTGEGDDLRYGLTTEGWEKGVEDPEDDDTVVGE